MRWMAVGCGAITLVAGLAVAPPAVAADPPPPPLDVAATAGDSAAVVTWTAPKVEGTTIHHYDVAADPGPATCTTPDATTTCTVTGLTNGTSYTFTVTATDEDHQTSKPSEPSGPVIPDIPPDPPTLSDLSAGDSEVTAVWCPGYNPGSPVIDFTATAQPGGRTCTRAPEPGDLWPYACNITGLTNLTTYTVTVVARNTGMTSAPSNARTAVPRIALGPPGNLTATPGPGAGEVSLAWTPPPDTGLPVLRYEVSAVADGMAVRGLRSVATSVTVDGLLPGRAYSFLVVAVNALDRSSTSTGPIEAPGGGPSGPDGGPTLVGWGRGGYGQLGTGNLQDAASPVLAHLGGALGDRRVVSLGIGAEHACAVTADGLVACWGTGWLTDGSWLAAAPVAQPGMPGPMAQVTVGDGFACALDRDGRAWCWGSGLALGNGTWTGSTTPVPVSTAGVLDGVTLVRIAAGLEHVCALDTSGRAYCWGENRRGELGDGTWDDSALPVAVDRSGVLAGVALTDIAAGYRFTCATDATGRVYCWGDNYSGQLGDGSGTQSLVPVVTGAVGGRDLDVGMVHACAVDDAGQVRCWGSNWNGQLGDGTTTDRLAPVPVAAGDCAGVATTGVSSCGVRTDGTVACWGEGRSGELGTGVAESSLVPVAVDRTGVLAGTAVVALDGSWWSMLALAATPPDAPATVTSSAGPGAATVTWTAPADHGGAIDTYRVTTSPGGATCTTSDHSCTVTGLSPGATYAVSVDAHNLAGWGPAAPGPPVTVPADGPVTPPVVTAPGRVTGLHVRLRRHTARITWAAVPSATGYVYRVKRPHRPFNAWRAATATRFTVRHATAGRYRVQVRAVNAAGTGPTTTKRFRVR